MLYLVDLFENESFKQVKSIFINALQENKLTHESRS